MEFKNLFNSMLSYTPEENYNFNFIQADDANSFDNVHTDIEKEIYKNAKVYPSLAINLEYMKVKYNFLINSDVILREFTLNARGKQYHAFIMYIDGMIDSDIMDNFILKPLMMRNKNNTYDGEQNKVISEAVANNVTIRKVKKFDLDSYVLNCLMPQNTVELVTEFSEIVSGINSRKLCFIY